LGTKPDTEVCCAKFHVDIAAFYNNYDHLLSVEPGAPFSESSPPRRTLLSRFLPQWVARPHGWIRDRSRLDPDAHLAAEGSYSYLHIDLEKKASSLDASSINQRRVKPHHQIAIQSSLDLPKKLEFDQTFRYVSSLPAQSSELTPRPMCDSVGMPLVL